VPYSIVDFTWTNMILSPQNPNLKYFVMVGTVPGWCPEWAGVSNRRFSACNGLFSASNGRFFASNGRFFVLNRDISSRDFQIFLYNNTGRLLRVIWGKLLAHLCYTGKSFSWYTSLYFIQKCFHFAHYPLK